MLVLVALPVLMLGPFCSSSCCPSYMPCCVSFAAVTVVNEDVQPRQYLMGGQTAQVKMKNVVPHDIGDPGEGSVGIVGEQRGCQAVGNGYGALNTCLLLSSVGTGCLGSCGATIPGVLKRSVDVALRDVFQWWN